jgi:hypothetical protein
MEDTLITKHDENPFFLSTKSTFEHNNNESFSKLEESFPLCVPQSRESQPAYPNEQQQPPPPPLRTSHRHQTLTAAKGTRTDHLINPERNCKQAKPN